MAVRTGGTGPGRWPVLALGGLALLGAVTAGAAWPPLPLPDALSGADRARAAELMAGADVSTRVEAEPFVSRPELFEFLLDHPEFAADLTRVLGLSRYRIRRAPPGLHVDDGWGATGSVRFLPAGPGRRVLLGRGQYRPRRLPTIHGEGLAILEYALSPLGAGRSRVAVTLTGFVKLDSRILAGVLSVAGGLARRKAEREARSLVRLFARTSQRLEEDPAGVVDTLRAHPEVGRADLEAFGRLLSR